jgi:anti-sigma factor RsiW
MLDGYADDSLSAEELAGLEEHLRDCPACAAEALGRVQLKRATREAAAMKFAPTADFRLRLEQSLGTQAAPKPEKPTSRKPGAWSWPLLGSLAAVVVVASLLFLWNELSAGQRQLAELVDLHVTTLASANPVDVVSTDRHTVKPWFQGRLPFTFNLPELQGTPYRLLGGRLAYIQQAACAQLLFEDGKHKISVFIESKATPGGGATIQQRGFTVERFTAGELRFTLISDAGASELNGLRDLLRTAAEPVR